MVNKFKKVVLGFCVFLATGLSSSYALNCPSSHDFFMHIASPPYSYHHQQNQVEIGAISISNNAVSGSDGQWLLVTKSILAQPQENHDVLVSNIVNHLENVNTSAYNADIPIENTTIHYCLYYLPGMATSEDFSAIAYFVPKKNTTTYQSLNKMIQAIA